MRLFIRTVLLALLYIAVLLSYKTVIAQHIIDCNASYNIKVFAKCKVTEKWDSSQWSAFDYIIERESNWIYTADNPNSSAYGLPQAMTSLHDLPEDYMTNPQSQIEWAIEYIEDRYSTPKKAQNYWNANKHY